MPPNTINNDTLIPIQAPVPTNPTKAVRFCHRRPSVGLTFSKFVYDRSSNSSSVVEDDSDDNDDDNNGEISKKPQFRRASAPLSFANLELSPLTCSPPPSNKHTFAPLDELALYKTKLAAAKGKDYHWAPLARIRRDSAP